MVRSNLKGATVNLLHPFLRVTDVHPFGSRGTGSVHIDSRTLPIFDHEQDVRVPFGFDVETSLVAFVFRHPELFRENSIQLRQAHTNLDRSGPVLTDNPSVTSKSSAESPEIPTSLACVRS